MQSSSRIIELMDRLWAPWRMAYIDSETKHQTAAGEIQPATCVFCAKSASNNAAQEMVIFKGELAFVLMNIFPYNNGHVMVAPYEHTARYDLLGGETLLEMNTLCQRAITAIGAPFHPDGYNIGINLGLVAGAGIADHLHLHVVPRWNGDANFMPVIGETKVLPDSLENTYRKIVEAWR